MCVYVRYRRPRRLTSRAEIWHGGLHPPLKGQRICSSQLPPNPWAGGVQNSIKQKLKNAPKLVVAGQVRSGPRPHPGVGKKVQGQEGLLQAWSLGCLGWNFAGRQGPTQQGQCICCGWIPPPPHYGQLEPKKRINSFLHFLIVLPYALTKFWHSRRQVFCYLCLRILITLFVCLFKTKVYKWRGEQSEQILTTFELMFLNCGFY